MALCIGLFIRPMTLDRRGGLGFGNLLFHEARHDSVSRVASWPTLSPMLPVSSQPSDKNYRRATSSSLARSFRRR